MTEFFNKYKTNIEIFVVSLAFWAGSVISSGKIFTSDELNMASLPKDYSMAPLMSILSKVLAFCVYYFGFLFLSKIRRRYDRSWYVFFGTLAIYLILFFASYPGYYMSDDAVIFGYATRFLPVYWHNYLTSLYFMTAMTIVPASVAPFLLNCCILAAVSTYLYMKDGKLMLIFSVLPFTLLSALMCFRPVLYAPVFLFFFAYMYYDVLHRADRNEVSVKKTVILSILAAVLCLWRSEGIVLIFFCIFLVPYSLMAPDKKKDPAGENDENVSDAKGIKVGDADLFDDERDPFEDAFKAGEERRSEPLQNEKRKQSAKVAGLIFFVVFALAFSVIKIPQTTGEEKYYGSDYLILATVRPLSLIIHRDQTYPGAEEDLENINKIVKLDYLSYETLSCTAFHRYNSDKNSGAYTQTLADKKTQSDYLKSAFRMIYHNLDLYIAERIQLFLITNGIYDYDPGLVMGMKPVETSQYALYSGDRDYGLVLIDGNKRLDINGTDKIAKFLFAAGGEAYIPMLVILIVSLVISIIKKNWFIAVTLLSLLAREGVIFLTAPASFIQYSYPMMFVTAWAFLVCIKRRT